MYAPLGGRDKVCQGNEVPARGHDGFGGGAAGRGDGGGDRGGAVVGPCATWVGSHTEVVNTY